MSASRRPYVGRFAPSPSGPLHAGSVVAALASWLDARAHGGQWLLRIEDIDPPRVEPGSEARIRQQLRFLGLHWDAPPWYQSARQDRYLAAFRHLQAQGLIFGCGCTRREISQAWRAWQAAHPASQPPQASPASMRLLPAAPLPSAATACPPSAPLPSSPPGQRAALPPAPSPGQPSACLPACPPHQTSSPLSASTSGPAGLPPQTHDETPYLGTCRHGLPPGRRARAWRFRVGDEAVSFDDRWLGPQRQHPARDCGDVVLRRADGVWAYQLAVVVDDAEAGITDIVRGADLLSSTGRQILLQRALGHPAPRYLHLPLLIGDNGQKLSKQNGAPAIDDSGRIEPADILKDAAHFLDLKTPGTRDPASFLHALIQQWHKRFCHDHGER